jgi:primosomal protein N' (replication factor Y)
MIVDVVFNLPVHRPFSYRVPQELTGKISVGQRVRAPLRKHHRIGLVVACREGAQGPLKPIESLVDASPPLTPGGLALIRAIAEESLTSWGSCAAALLPPHTRGSGFDVRGPSHESRTPIPEPPTPNPDSRIPELLTGGDREVRLLKALGVHRERGGLLLLVPEIEDASVWARRLESELDLPVRRLDSGQPARLRWQSWADLANGTARIAVGTHSALLAPLPAPATLALLDEHDSAHKPPGAARFHSRDGALARARAEGHRLLLTSATPSVESWWRAESGQFSLSDGAPTPWPSVSVVDLRERSHGIPLSPPLCQAVADTLRDGRQVLLLITKLGAGLACQECGHFFRCPECEIALCYSRASRDLSCRLCRWRSTAPSICPSCRGRRFSTVGWSAEQTEEAVRRNFPKTPVMRYDGELARGRRRMATWRAIKDGAVGVVIGTRAVLKAVSAERLGAIGVITPDPLLRLPDFRAAERTFSFLWAAAERAGQEARLVVQTQHPNHYAMTAVAQQQLTLFYKHELRYRAELRYPPFSRLARIAVRAPREGVARTTIDELARELSALPHVTVYGPSSIASRPRGRRWQLLLKGGQDLPALLSGALRPVLDRRRSGSAVVEIEMDPLELV